MKRGAILAAVVILSVPALWRVAEACGDKLLLVGHGARFGRAYAAIHPAHILIYARPSIAAKAAIRDPKLHNALRQAGHAVSVIEDPPLLEQALHTGAVDVVLADVADWSMVEPAVSKAASKAALRCVFVPPPNKEEARRVKPEFACPLKASDSVARYLDVIEDTMKARATGQPADFAPNSNGRH
jgi:hypothetical protein